MRKLTSLAAASALLLLTAVPSFAAGGNSTATLSGGALSITGAAPGDFSGTSTAGTQTLYSTLGHYNATDGTGSGAGWHLTMQATQFTTVSTPVRTLPAGSLFMAAPAVACGTGNPCGTTTSKPVIGITGQANALDTTSAVTVSSNAVDTGMGSYDFTPADFTGHTGSQLQLVIPAAAYSGSYTSTLTVSIITAP
jgi:hypothetical protein